MLWSWYPDCVVEIKRLGIFSTADGGAIWLVILVAGNIVCSINTSPFKLTNGSRVTHSLFSFLNLSHLSPFPQYTRPFAWPLTP